MESEADSAQDAHCGYSFPTKMATCYFLCFKRLKRLMLQTELLAQSSVEVTYNCLLFNYVFHALLLLL